MVYGWCQVGGGSCAGLPLTSAANKPTANDRFAMIHICTSISLRSFIARRKMTFPPR
jgi:hypothetical protein